MKRAILTLALVSLFAATTFAQSLTVDGGPFCLGGRASTSITVFARAFDAANDPAVNVWVTFDLTYPNGDVALKRGKTNQNGFAQASFKFNQFGSYTLAASATVEDVPLTASSTFDVTDCGL